MFTFLPCPCLSRFVDSVFSCCFLYKPHILTAIHRYLHSSGHIARSSPAKYNADYIFTHQDKKISVKLSTIVDTFSGFCTVHTIYRPQKQCPQQEPVHMGRCSQCEPLLSIRKQVDHVDWSFCKVVCYLNTKAITGLDRESAHPLQLHAAKRSCCTAAKLGATDQSSP